MYSSLFLSFVILRCVCIYYRESYGILVRILGDDCEISVCC